MGWVRVFGADPWVGFGYGQTRPEPTRCHSYGELKIEPTPIRLCQEDKNDCT